MNGTRHMTDLLLRIFDARQRQSEREEESLIQLLHECDEYQRVSSIVGVYLLFCLFVLAFLALFLCHSMQALRTSLLFFVLGRHVWQVFKYQIPGVVNRTKPNQLLFDWFGNRT